MKLITVIEDTPGSLDCSYEHGLCIYVETKKHKLLLDTGATTAFINNAKKLGIDLQKIDTVVLSHGHYDHSGGILTFAGLNPNAAIYMQKEAAGDYFHGERYIGIDKKIAELPTVHMLDGDIRIDEELFLYSGITGRRFWPQSNLVLSKRQGRKRMQDVFSHEQCLVISTEGKHLLLSGCAHNGILNILDKYKSIYHKMPDVVISGFHMMKKSEYTREETEIIQDTARELYKLDTLFYTGHCTGQPAFDMMREIMGEKLMQIHSGQEILSH